MAKGLGNNYLLWVESSTPGTYNLIKGQQNLKITRQAPTFDTSTKDDAGYGTSAPGLRSITIDLDMVPNLPDATGYTRLETLAGAVPAAPFNIQIRKGAASGSGTDVVFAASMYGVITDSDFPQNGPASAKAQFSLAAAPTTDTLAI